MKNRIEMKQKGNIINIKIIAKSEKSANKIFDAIELFGNTLVRVDLEREWNSDLGGG